jgi:hypothetical protein
MGAEILVLYLSFEIFLRRKGKIEMKRKSLKNKKIPEKVKNENEKCSFCLL